MEYSRTCFDEQGIIRKNSACRITLFATYLILTMLLTILAAAYSYAAETLALDQAIGMVLRSKPGLKTADAGVLRSSSGFLPLVTVSETWSRTDSPLMAHGTKLNREIVNFGLNEGSEIGLRQKVTGFSESFNPDTEQWERL